jgi:hypothetical protein
VAAEHGWQRRFDELIETPDGTRLKLLTYAAERGAAWMFLARMAVSKALHRRAIVLFNPDASQSIIGESAS